MNRMQRKSLEMSRRWRRGAARWVAIVVLAFAGVSTVSPAAALAQSQDQEDIVDARLEGYTTNVSLKPGGSALTYILFIILAVIAAAGLFKDAKRSHLD